MPVLSLYILGIVTLPLPSRRLAVLPNKYLPYGTLAECNQHPYLIQCLTFSVNHNLNCHGFNLSCLSLGKGTDTLWIPKGQSISVSVKNLIRLSTRHGFSYGSETHRYGAFVGMDPRIRAFIYKIYSYIILSLLLYTIELGFLCPTRPRDGWNLSQRKSMSRWIDGPQVVMRESKSMVKGRWSRGSMVERDKSRGCIGTEARQKVEPKREPGREKREYKV
jgi:hypothetical protein